jgi:hypothetical protein
MSGFLSFSLLTLSSHPLSSPSLFILFALSSLFCFLSRLLGWNHEALDVRFRAGGIATSRSLLENDRLAPRWGRFTVRVLV